MAKQTIIPAATRLVVKTPSGEAKWHNIREDIVLLSEPVEATCPRTSRKGILSYNHNGFTLYFTEQQMRTRDGFTAEDIDATVAANLKACLLIYDIPEGATYNLPTNAALHEKPILNPSGFLRTIGVRVNLSCWVIPEGDIPYTLLNNLRSGGATWHVVRFAPEEGRKLIEMAIDSLRREISDAVSRSETARQNAEEQLAEVAEVTEAGEVAKAEARFLRRAEGIQTRYKELVEGLEKAAEKFGINRRVLNLNAANAAIQAIQTGMQVRAEAYVKATAALKATGTATGQALAAAAEADQLPAGIAADYLLDEGKQVEADSLTAAFNAKPAAEDAESELFSLAGVGTDDDAA